jgi:purine-binding chemotaxis protein CheW
MTSAADMQVVTLGIEADRFAIPVTAVREILDMQALFRLPEAPPHVAGLADVRGRAVPVIDLRTRLGLPPQQTTEHTRILVLDVGTLTIGLIADRVFEVTAIPRDHLDPAPDLGQSWKAQYIQNVAKRAEGGLLMLLDVGAVIDAAPEILKAPAEGHADTLRVA